VRKPNFFIIGAPKSGTTSLANYLREHPRIFFSALKELHYFNSDMTYRTVTSEPHYYKRFHDAGPEHLAVGEGSILYLYSDAAVPRILEELPGAKFVVLLRNPLEMATSWHAEVRSLAEDNIFEFAAAWRKQDARKNGRDLPPFCRDPSLLLYGAICSTGWQIRRLYSRVPRERVLVLFQDDLKHDPRSVYLRTLEFLGVPDDGREVFTVYNQRRSPIRFYSLQVAIRSLYQLKAKLRLQSSFGFLPMLIRLNVGDARVETLEPEFRAELANYFRNDVEELSSLVGRDLSEWLQV
jgi:Sulfotransferase domain